MTAEQFEAAQAEATQSLHAVACVGCGTEPEVVRYYVDTKTKIRRGYVCTCGTAVINGLYVTGGMR